MCQINIIHFSHPEAQAASNRSSNPSSIATALNLPFTRLTTDEFLSRNQPPHEFALCPMHINNNINNSCCVAYKQTMPCLLWKLHSSDVAGNVAGGVNAAECPSLSVTHEHHPLSIILPVPAPVSAMVTGRGNENKNQNGESESKSKSVAVEPQGFQFQFQNLAEARAAVLDTADEIHQQKLTLDRTSELMELLFSELAEACATLQRVHEPAAKRQAFFSRELEKPLNQCAELCQKIREADEKICELFKAFLGKRKGMVELVVAFERKNKESSSMVQEELAGWCGDVYPVGKARQVLWELSVANVVEVCEGSVRRGRELREEMVRLLEGVERFM